MNSSAKLTISADKIFPRALAAAGKVLRHRSAHAASAESTMRGWLPEKFIRQTSSRRQSSCRNLVFSGQPPGAQLSSRLLLEM